MLGIFAFVAAGLYLPAWLPSGQVVSSASLEKPNIILIGLDSLRPDHIGYFGHQDAHTPTIDRFLASSVVFTNAYTPLARTFPSWVSILTAKYPLRSHARANLVAPDRVVANDMLAKRLQADGYFTIYGTDETRFTDITQAYGFDRLIGPAGGAAEFLLGSLSDFPLSNLLLNVPAGKYLFPYQYANRAADVTYRPEQFLALVKAGLAHRPQGPVFLSLHLCLPHWPFKWARDGFAPDASTASRYQGSIAAVDAQLSSLLSLLQEAGLLDHSIVVLLSDHGVTLGARGDRVIAKERYVGDPKQMKAVTVMKLGSAPEMTTDFKRDYSVIASYGQGTDVLSLKQNHVLMAFNGFGLQWPAKKVGAFVSLFDIAPTVLGYLHLQPLHLADGISLGAYFSSRPAPQSLPRTFFIETGDKLAETEVDQIDVAAVVKGAINAYRVDIGSGRLVLTDSAEKNIVENKQHAIIWRDWLLARYPADVRYQMVPDPADGKKKVLLPKRTDPYFVLVNLKTGQWTVGLSSAFAKSAPVVDLMRQFRAFYGSEVA
jgi:arylsulfatase A-like enzyme